MGIAGRIARAFLQSKLTPLVTVASLLVGLLGLIATPREEEPQISIPMIDVLAAMPGASPHETENLLGRPIESRMWEIPGVEHVYTSAGDGYALVTRSEEHTSELQSRENLVCRLLLEKKKKQ